ncbi:MAG: copper chaperone PCu(A)C [Microbacteriaceae bacterium]|nr:MAG: copper chaperone PCu(A)C [Microbacteriaceae bacterium]
MNTRTTHRPAVTLTLAATAVLALAGCATTAPDQSAEPATAGQSVTITDAWVKAADDGMSAAFGDLTNTGDADVILVSVTSPASTSMQLHETVDNGSGSMVMQERDGGFTIPAGGTLTLEPGGNHLMLMDLTAPILAGDEIEFTLTFSDGSDYAFTAPAKDYSGANETYMGDDMNMGGND